MKRVEVIFIHGLVCTLLAFGCGSDDGREGDGGSGAAGSGAAGDGAALDLSVLFPAAEDLSGVVRAERYREYDEGKLFEYMNGGAEVFLALAFSRVGTRVYETSLGEDVFLTAEVYDMGNAEDAKEIFSRENGARKTSADVGSESSLGGGQIAFRRDRYYVKIRCDDVGDDVDRLLESAAGHLDRALEDRS